MHIKNNLILSKVFGFFVSWKKGVTSVWLPTSSSTCTLMYRNVSTICFRVAVRKGNPLSHMLLWQGQVRSCAAVVDSSEDPGLCLSTAHY